MARIDNIFESRFLTPIILVLVIIVGLGNLLYSHTIAQQVATQQEQAQAHCEFRAVQVFDAAITARTHLSNAANAGLQSLIIAVFTQHGTQNQIRAADLAAFATWRAEVARLAAADLPPLPRTACG